MFGRLGWAEILVIVVLLVILFGHNKIPGMMKNLADGINVFKREVRKTSDKKEKKSETTAKKSDADVRKVQKSGAGLKKKKVVKK